MSNNEGRIERGFRKEVHSDDDSEDIESISAESAPGTAIMKTIVKKK